MELDRKEIQARVRQGEIRPQPRVHQAEIPVAERLNLSTEVELGYTEEQARQEAGRCLSCGVCSECLSCSFECKAGAINHDEAGRSREIHVGAVVMAPGFQAYRAELSEEYGLGRYPNVVTSLQFERLLSASGPTQGHVLRPSDGKPARKIAFLQCVGSRDQNHDYCSSVCCMYAAKEAIMAREHDSKAEVTVFFMDTRAFSKGYSAYYRRAQERYGIRYERCRVSSLKEDPKNGNLNVRYVHRDEADAAAAGSVKEEPFDLVVLSVGMEISPAVQELGRRLELEMDEYGFCRTLPFRPLADQQTRCLCGWPLPRAQGHSRIRDRSQRRGGLGGPFVECVTRRPGQPSRVSAGTRYPAGRTAGRCLRLPLRVEHRRLPRCSRSRRLRTGTCPTWCTRKRTCIPARRIRSSASPIRPKRWG